MTLYPHSSIVAIEAQREWSSSREEFSSCWAVAVGVDSVQGLWETAEETLIGLIFSLKEEGREGGRLKQHFSQIERELK